MNAKHLSIAALVLLSCGINHEIEPCGSSHVAVALSSVTLANDCGGGAARAEFAGDVAAGACAEGNPCPSLCRQSSMQLAFDSTSMSAAKIEIKAVRLLDKNTRALIETLTSREPQEWNADMYRAWNELVPAGASLKTTYKLSAPGFNSATGAFRYSYQPYLVEVDVSVDGDVRTLQVEATREPEVAT